MDSITPPEVQAEPMPVPKKGAKGLQINGGLYLIAVFEVIKAALFLVAAAGVFHIINRDTQVELTKLLHVFRINGDWRVVKPWLVKARLVDPYKMRIGVILMVYAVLHATEGTGLLLRKRWAEYFTIIMTAIPLPYEIYLLVHHTTHSGMAAHVPLEQRHEVVFNHWVLLKMCALVGNAAIVAYLVYHLRKSGGRHGAAAPVEPLE